MRCPQRENHMKNNRGAVRGVVCRYADFPLVAERARPGEILWRREIDALGLFLLAW